MNLRELCGSNGNEIDEVHRNFIVFNHDLQKNMHNAFVGIASLIREAAYGIGSSLMPLVDMTNWIYWDMS